MNVDQKANRSLVVTSELIKIYAGITSDYKRLHFDEEFAKKTKFGKLIGLGGITNGFLNLLVSNAMTGSGLVFLHQKFDYLKPVFIGDEITGELEIYEAYPTKSISRIHVSVKNQTNEEVMVGKVVCYAFNVD